MDWTKLLANKLLAVALPFYFLLIIGVLVSFCFLSSPVWNIVAFTYLALVVTSLPVQIFGWSDICCWSKCASPGCLEKLTRFVAWWVEKIFVEFSIIGLLLGYSLIGAFYPNVMWESSLKIWQKIVLIIFYIFTMIPFILYATYLVVSTKQERLIRERILA